MQEITGLGDSNMMAIAAGFGGGIGRSQSVCGALTGAVMAMGLHEGRQPRTAKEMAGAARPPSRQLYQAFENRWGRTDCRGLTGHDFNNPDEMKAFTDSGARATKCALYIEQMITETIARVTTG